MKYFHIHRWSYRYLGMCLLLSMSVAHGAVLDVVNELRDGGCNPRSKLPALQIDTRLQAVAKRIAKGDSVQQAAQAAAYPATQLSTIHLAGYRRDAEVRQLLAGKYCKLLMNPEWQQLGSEWRGNEVWIVLAEPHAIPRDAAAVAQEILQRVNQARSSSRRCGRERYAATEPLRLHAALTKAAQLHAQDMAQHEQMQHAGSDGSTPAQRLTRQGYRWKTVGENVAAGAGTAEEVVAGWLDSPGHCANLMSPEFSDMGVGFAVNTRDSYTVYWAQTFATPR